MTRRLVLFTFTLIACMLFAAACLAAEAAPSKPLPDKPAIPEPDRATAVAVEHEGTDTLGARLAFQLKGAFNSSSLFTLTDKDVPKLKVFIATVEEFPSRPHIASAYSIVWAFSQAEGTLSFLLAREVGLVTAEELDALVAKIAERTDGIAVKYAYLFDK